MALLLNSEVIAGVIAFEHGCVVAELLGVSRTHHCPIKVCVKAVLAARAWPELVCSDLEQKLGSCNEETINALMTAEMLLCPQYFSGINVSSKLGFLLRTHKAEHLQNISY